MAINRHYYPIKYKTRTEAISNGVTCVFISHQKNDKDQAKKVADYLMSAGIDVYFDEYDFDLKIQKQTGNPSEVTKSICNGINNSSHMVVIVSSHTLISSWVPFEIGYGFEKTDLGVLCLKGIPKGGLPEYVLAAPIIRDIYDLNNFVEKITKKSKETLIESRMLSNYNNSSNPLYGVMDSIIT
jgi:hypothetical protein